MKAKEKHEARQLRGGLLLRGITLTEWANKHGYVRTSVHHALAGRRRGPKHRRMVEQLRAELGCDR